MIKLNQDHSKRNYVRTLTLALLMVTSFILLSVPDRVEARTKRGDDIIIMKGKLIMRGDKGRGNLILDTGSSKSHEHAPMMHMMPMMGHHFNPYSFYPMQQHHQAPMVIHPIYMEDHSAMNQHEQHHQGYGHEEPQEYKHHEMEYGHHEMHHEPQHEIHHEPMQHEMQHMGGHHYEPEGHHEQDHEGHMHGGYESHPMMSMMMHGGSGLQPTYQQLAAMQAAAQQQQQQQHQPSDAYALQAIQAAQSFPGQQVDIRQHQQQQQQARPDQQQQADKPQRPQQAAAADQQNKKVSLLDQASNNPLVAIIKPLFSRSPAKQKKP